MSEPARKPDIRELYGSAVNSSRLSSRADAYEMPIDRLGAMGGAALAVASGAERQRLPVSAVQEAVVRRSTGNAAFIAPAPDAQERAAAEVAQLLWHLFHGNQTDVLGRAATAFAAWLRYRPRLREATDTEIGTLALRVLTERLHAWCQACGGSGKQERTQRGNWVRPLGRGQRNAHFRTCAHCHGSRRALPSHPERMRLLGLTREKYEAAHWPTHFTACHAWVDQVERRLAGPLTAQLERRKRRC